MFPSDIFEFEGPEFEFFVLTKHFLETKGNKRSLYWLNGLDTDTLELIIESSSFVVFTDPENLRPVENEDDDNMATDFTFLTMAMIGSDHRIRSKEEGSSEQLSLSESGELDIPETDLESGIKFLHIATHCELLIREGVFIKEADTSHDAGFLLTDGSVFIGVNPDKFGPFL